MKQPQNFNWMQYGLALFFWLIGNGSLPVATQASEEPKNGLIASPEPDWPQWRGPRRDGICDETGLLGAWPEGGPKLLWQKPGWGNGYSCPIIVKDRLYLTGDVEEHLEIYAADLQGNLLWRATNGMSWTGPYPGARACVAYSQDHLYHKNAHGRVACLEALTGREKWAVNTLERFQAENITWGISECLLVDGKAVYVTVGGKQALMAALDKLTGKTLWASEPLRFPEGPKFARAQAGGGGQMIDHTSYASPILVQMGGKRLLLNCSWQHMFGVDADTGKLLWTQPLTTKYQVLAATPVWIINSAFFTGPDSQGGTLISLVTDGQDGLRAKQSWISNLDTCHGCVVFKEGILFGSYYRHTKGWGALDAKTGQVLHQIKDLAMGSVIHADGRFYCLDQEGQMALIKPSAASYEIAGRFRLTGKHHNDVWAHPVIHQGRLYLRYQDTLYCYDIRAR